MSEAPNSGPRRDAGGGLDLGRYVAVILRYLWLILALTALGVAAGVLFHEERVASYQSTATIMIQPTAPPIVGDMDSTLLMWSAYLDGQRFRSTQLRVMTSRIILEQVAERLDLGNDRSFLGLEHVDDPDELADAMERADAVSRLRSVVEVKPELDTMMVTITARCTVPRYCADIANTLAETYAEYNYTQRISSGASAEDWLRGQYQTTRERLEQAEEELLAYRRDRGLLSVSLDDQFNLIARDLETVTGQLAEAEFEVVRLQTSYNLVQRIRRSGDYLSAGLLQVVDNALIQQLKAQLITLETERIELSSTYLDGHPRMIANAAQTERVTATLEREIDNALAGMALEYETAVNLRASLRTRLDTAYSEALGLGDSQLEYDRMQRAVEATRAVFTALESRLKEVELANQLEPNNVQLVEPARVPGAPTGSGGIPLALITGLIGLALGLAVAVGIETLDQTVKTQEQLEGEFGLPFLGLIPTMQTVRASGPSSRGPRRGEAFNPDTYVNDYPKSSAAEACRSIRTNLMFMSTERPLRRILVTSSAPLEGKTTSAISMATVLAQSGARVLIVDSDMRRPRLHLAFRMEPTAGLTSLLLGEVTPEQAIVASPIDGVDLLPCGAIPPNPTELLYTQRFKDVIDDLDARYDILVFDAPPVSPVTDSVVLSALVDGVLLVVRAARTRRDLLARTVDQLDAVEANILGAVLNDVDLTSRSQGYYYYYHRQYGHYYGRDDA